MDGEFGSQNPTDISPVALGCSSIGCAGGVPSGTGSSTPTDVVGGLVLDGAGVLAGRLVRSEVVVGVSAVVLPFAAVTVGVGSVSHLAAELLQEKTGAKFTLASYKVPAPRLSILVVATFKPTSLRSPVAMPR